jgi:hypothetical protein
MEEDEAQQYGFRLSKAVSLTSMIDELRDKNNNAFEDKATLDDWVNQSVSEYDEEEDEEKKDNGHVDLQDNTTIQSGEPKKSKVNNAPRATLNFATASFAVRFLKARQARLDKINDRQAEHYRNNDILPRSIPVDIYLESLKTLKGQKEHRRVDLFKELREKKAIKRRDESFRVRLAGIMCVCPSSAHS